MSDDVDFVMKPSKTTKKIKRKAKHKFTSEEDKKLEQLVHKYGENSWEDIAEQMGDRNPRQVKDRWTRYVSPDVNKTKWTIEEEKLLIRLVKKLNFKWVKIAKHFKGRTDNQIKNKWNVLKKYVDIPKTPPAIHSPSLEMDMKLKSIPQKEDHSIPQQINAENTKNPDVLFANIFSHLDNGYLEQIFSNDDSTELTYLFGF